MKPVSHTPTNTSARSVSPLDTLAHLDWWALFTKIFYLIWQPLVEIFYGIRKGAFPWAEAMLAGIICGGLVATHCDIVLFRVLRIAPLYPYWSVFYWSYCFLSLTVGFWSWGLYQAALRNRLVHRLTDVFALAGLKNSLGRFPKFIFDRPIDGSTRKMRLTRSGLSLDQFKKSQSVLESNLQVYIDDIRETREDGTVDIIYAHHPMPTLTQLDDIRSVGRLKFVVGKTRARQVFGAFRETPHLLVAGQTGGGKSSFLRELIATLYVNNPQLKMNLIDLKGGLEFQIFENLDRVKVVPDVKRAVAALTGAAETLQRRMELLKSNGCADIDAYQARLKKEREEAASNAEGTTAVATDELARELIVIDEAAEMFLAGNHASTKDIQEARQAVSQIARLGRSVGVHLVVATQRPDSRALDPQVKANLTGVLCFQMQNDASSISVLGVGRATDLPPIPGRAIWRAGAEMTEVQVPYMSVEEVNELLKTVRVAPPSIADAETAAGRVQ